MASEYTDVVAAAFMDRLCDDPTFRALGVQGLHDTDLPQATTAAEREALYPCVVFNLQAAGRVLYGNGDTIVWSPAEYQVFGIDEWESFERLVPISARIFQRLHGFNGSVTGGGYIQTCAFRRSIKLAPQGSGKPFRYLGGLYSIAARLSAS